MADRPGRSDAGRPVAATVLIAAQLATGRARRDDMQELFDSFAVSAATRTLAHLTALAAALAKSRSVAAIGAAVGVKMVTAGLYHVPTWASPVFVAAVLAVVISIGSPHRTHLRSNPAGFHREWGRMTCPAH